MDVTWLTDSRGWLVRSVAGDDDRELPASTRTVGLAAFGHPELVVYGLRPHHAARVLDELAEQVGAGALLRAGEKAWAAAINPHELRLCAAPGTSGAALQVVWADPNGAFPWQPGFRNPQWLQPMPDRFAARSSRRMHEVAS